MSMLNGQLVDLLNFSVVNLHKRERFHDDVLMILDKSFKNDLLTTNNYSK